MEMCDEEAGGSVGPEGPTLSELVDRELAVMKMVDGVTSVYAYSKKRREPLNKSMLKVRIAGRENPLSSHCGKEIPDLLVAAQEMWKKIEEELGSDAVAEGRRRYGAELEAAAPTAAPAASEATRPADQPLNFFLHSKLVQRNGLPGTRQRGRDHIRHTSTPT